MECVLLELEVDHLVKQCAVRLSRDILGHEVLGVYVVVMVLVVVTHGPHSCLLTSLTPQAGAC